MLAVIMFTISIRSFSSRRFHECYNLLQVRRNSTPQDIREAFLRLSKIYHPDNIGTGNQQKFIRIKDAFEKIKHAPLQSGKTDYLSDEVDADLSHKAYVEYVQSTNTFVSQPIGGGGKLYNIRGAPKQQIWSYLNPFGYKKKPLTRKINDIDDAPF